MTAETTAAKPRILVVEDEAIVACDIQSQLESFNYQVAGIASSGDEALEMAAEGCPDLALMDIKLRGSLNGVQVAEQLRRERSIRSVFLTANFDQEIVQQAKLAEPLGYLRKPYQETDLRIALDLGLYRARMEREREELTQNLASALAEDKDLRGVILVCAWCRKIRTVEGRWLSLEAYLRQAVGVGCSHGICPACFKQESAKLPPS